MKSTWCISLVLSLSIVTTLSFSNFPQSRGRSPMKWSSLHSENGPGTPGLLLGDIADDKISLPRHPSNEKVNSVLTRVEELLQGYHSDALELSLMEESESGESESESETSESEEVFSNSYVDLGKVDTVGFDYDYTLVTYTEELLHMIYDMALSRLVEDKYYPKGMLTSNKMRFDPSFSIRGLAVDRVNGWICHLTYTHHVSVAWEGRTKVSRERLMEEYTGKRSLIPSERKKRLKPLNDLFSMSECCLIANTIQYFKKEGIPYCAKSVVKDVLGAIGDTHISGDFHRKVASKPEKYFEPNPHLKDVTRALKDSGKRLIFVSNSPYWYVDAGMTHIYGEKWRDLWDAVIVSAGKPTFYKDSDRPFREVSTSTGRVKFKKIDRLEPGEVYMEGCLKELTRCLDWSQIPQGQSSANMAIANGQFLSSPNVLYIGDSLFADLVDAKREFGWTTAAVTPEVRYEIGIKSKSSFKLATLTIESLISCLRIIQAKLGNSQRTQEDLELMDRLEYMVSIWRDKQVNLSGNSFGSIFRARYQPSLFAHSIRRYCDLYMTSVSSLRHYSPQHRFYPHDVRLLSHETRGPLTSDCMDLESLIDEEESKLVGF